MKKSKFFIVGILVTVLVFGLAVIGCDDAGDDVGNEHQCSPSSWGYDDIRHWRKCSCGNETGNRGLHSYTYYPSLGYNDWPCTICV